MKFNKKTDNFNLGMKLDLRRKLLDEFHGDNPIRVLDCCQGSGIIWSHLRKEYNVTSYWGADLKPRGGRLTVDSVRILEKGVKEDVIDVDTYGSPWKHWRALLPTITKPVTLFMTKGFISKGVSTIGRDTMEVLGLKAPWITPVRLGFEVHGHRLPQTLQRRLDQAAVPYWIQEGIKYADIIKWYQCSSGNAIYMGLRLEPFDWK